MSLLRLLRSGTEQTFNKSNRVSYDKIVDSEASNTTHTLGTLESGFCHSGHDCAFEVSDTSCRMLLLLLKHVNCTAPRVWEQCYKNAEPKICVLLVTEATQNSHKNM